MARERRAEWAKRIEEWKRSGQTGARFAAEAGVKEGTLRHWKWELGRKAKAAVAGKPRFVRVTRVAAGATEEAARMEIVLGNGVRILVPAQFDAGALRRVLDVAGAS